MCPGAELGPHAPQSEAGIWGPHHPLGAAPPLLAPQGPVQQEIQQQEEGTAGRRGEGRGNAVQSEGKGRVKGASKVRCQEKWKNGRVDKEMKIQQTMGVIFIVKKMYKVYIGSNNKYSLKINRPLKSHLEAVIVKQVSI